jgi:hypothetical protein
VSQGFRVEEDRGEDVDLEDDCVEFIRDKTLRANVTVRPSDFGGL